MKRNMTLVGVFAIALAVALSACSKNNQKAQTPVTPIPKAEVKQAPSSGQPPAPPASSSAVLLDPNISINSSLISSWGSSFDDVNQNCVQLIMDQSGDTYLKFHKSNCTSLTDTASSVMPDTDLAFTLFVDFASDDTDGTKFEIHGSDSRAVGAMSGAYVDAGQVVYTIDHLCDATSTSDIPTIPACTVTTSNGQFQSIIGYDGLNLSFQVPQ